MRFVISAAGVGSRLGINMPKCMLPIIDGRLIDYQLALLPPNADVRVVVGFMETEVINHVHKRWPNVIFVRNPAFATTSNTHSLALAMSFFDGPCITIDGDLLIDKLSFESFIAHCETATTSIVGVVEKTSQDAISVQVEDDQVIAFWRPETSFQASCSLEWCGIAYLNGIKLSPNQGYVFEELAKHLPLPALEIICREIDTPQDLDVAMQALKSGALKLAPLSP